MSVQTETNQDEDKGLVYNHDKARVLATIITTFNKHMEETVEEQGLSGFMAYHQTQVLCSGCQCEWESQLLVGLKL